MELPDPCDGCKYKSEQCLLICQNPEIMYDGYDEDDWEEEEEGPHDEGYYEKGADWADDEFADCYGPGGQHCDIQADCY